MKAVAWIMIVVMVATFAGLWGILGFTWLLAAYGLVGLIIGGLGRLLVPGSDGLGMLPTIAAGISGAFVGGLVAAALDAGQLLGIGSAVLVAALVTSLILRIGRVGTGDTA